MVCVERRPCDADCFDRIFHPEHLAIVGVSAKGFGFGGGILMSLRQIGFEGTIYPVNSRGGEIAGMKIYKGVDEIPVRIDFAIIAVPAEAVPDALDACRRKGAAGAEVLSAGFSELGTPEGIALEERIREAAGRGIRVVGPNCFGIYCPRSGLTLLPGPDLSRESGTVAFLAQSGGMAIDFSHIGKWMGIRFSKVVSFGNGADLREVELLDYLGDDPETRVISTYTEGVEDGPAFLETLRRVTRKKPVIVHKGGLSEAGGRAVASHTASMGGSRVIWEAVLRQCNAVQVTSLWELAQTSLAFAMLPERVYQGITVAGGGGALGIAACDAAEAFDIEIPQLDPAITDAIMEILPKPGSSAKNPIDVANPHVPPHILKDVLLTAAKDEKIDLQILIQLFYHYKSMAFFSGQPVKDVTPFKELAAAVEEVVAVTGKPVILVAPNIKQGLESLDIEEMLREARSVFLEKGIPVFDDLEEALRAVNHVSRYCARKRALEQQA